MRFSKPRGLRNRVMQMETAIVMHLCVSAVSLNHGNHKHPKPLVILHSGYETGLQMNGRCFQTLLPQPIKKASLVQSVSNTHTTPFRRSDEGKIRSISRSTDNF